MRDLGTILADIDAFDPRRYPDGFRALDRLVQELAAAAPSCDAAVPVLLGVFERFPRHDGHEVFWSLLHYLEDVPSHEPSLLASLERAPNHMTVTMLQRWINAGFTNAHGVDLVALLARVEPLAPDVDQTLPPELSP